MGFFNRKKSADKASGVPVGKVTLTSSGEVEIKQRIDCLGDSCPRPQLMTKKALSAAGAGDIFEILIDNPSSMEAIPPMLPDLQASHLETVKAERCWQVYVRKD